MFPQFKARQSTTFATEPTTEGRMHTQSWPMNMDEFSQELGLKEFPG